MAKNSNRTPINNNQEDPIPITDDDSLTDLSDFLNARRASSATAEPTSPLQKSTEEPQKENEVARRADGAQSASCTTAAPDVSTALQPHTNGKENTSDNATATKNTEGFGLEMMERSRNALSSRIRCKTPAQPCADMEGPSAAGNGGPMTSTRPPTSPTNARLQKGVKGIAPTSPKRRSLESHPNERHRLSNPSPATPALGQHPDTLAKTAQDLTDKKTSNFTTGRYAIMSSNADRQDQTDVPGRSNLIKCTECDGYFSSLSKINTHYANVHPGKKNTHRRIT